MIINSFIFSSPPLFDAFSTTNLGIWSLKKERSAYAGPCVRAGLAADSGATTLDIGFTSSGEVDMAAYAAFGTGSERIITWYDQSGNGFDLSRAWSATLCPILRTSSYNAKSCLYFSQGSLGNSGFTDWNGLADANFYIAAKPVAASSNGFLMAGGNPARYLYSAAGTATREMRWDTSSGAESQYYMTARVAGFWQRFQYDGGAAGQTTIARMYQNGVEETRDTSSGTHGTTLANETGIYFNGDSAGNNSLNQEYFTIYYIGYALNAPEEAAIDASLRSTYFTLNRSQLICVGDSLTAGVGTAAPWTDPANYPFVLQDALEAATGTTWDLSHGGNFSEAGAETERVLQMMQGGGNALDLIDTNYDNTVLCAWAGTNDFAKASPDSVATVHTGSSNISTPADSLGADVYYGNMIPRTDLDAIFGAGSNAAFETNRTSYNSGLAAALGATATIVPLASRPELDDSTDTTYYDGDLVHLNPTGYAAVADAFFDAIQPNLN